MSVFIGQLTIAVRIYSSVNIEQITIFGGIRDQPKEFLPGRWLKSAGADES